MAALAAACGVLAGWDLLTAVERGPLVRRVLALLRLGERGQAPSAAERRRLIALLAGSLFAAGWLLAGPVAGAVLALAGPLGARALVDARRRWRAGLLDGAPAVTRAVADALAGGHSVRGALAEAATGGVSGPAGEELRRVAHALALGEPTEHVLEALRARAEAPAYDALVAAILLQRDAGGDLARLLRDLAASLEHAVRLERDARAVTAQARFTGTLVAALPLGAAALAELARPGFLAGLLSFAPSAVLLVAAAVLQLAAGLLAIRRLSRVAA